MKLHQAVHIIVLTKKYQRSYLLLKKVSGSRSTIVELVIIL
jgi:hypothetical protein